MSDFSPIYGQNPNTGTQEAVQTDGAHHLAQAISGPSGNPVFANVFAGNELRIAEEPTQLFLDDASSGSLDTTNRWAAPTAAGGGVAAAVSNGTITLGTGTTANGYSFLQSAVTFPPVNPGWLLFQASINLPSPYIANSYMAWGLGTSPGTPTAAAPLTDFAGFELAIGGKMYAVCYAGGTRNQIADLSTATGTGKQPTDANAHIYSLYFRGDRMYWTIDGQDATVASIVTGTLGPNVNTLPLKFTTIAGASNPASSAVLAINQVFLADTTKREVQLSDGTFPWRKATVDANGNLSVKQSSPPISSTATLTSVASSASTVSLLASNTARKGAYFFNDSTAILYLAYAATSSTSAYTVQVPANSFFEMPTEPVYQGAIAGIWSAANGNARITELT